MATVHDSDLGGTVVLEATAVPAEGGLTFAPPVTRVAARARRLLIDRFLLGDQLTLIALAVWTAIPLAIDVVYVARHGGEFTGVQTTFAPDTFQYLSWVRDSGSHLLIGDNFQLIGPSQAVFLQPMLLLSGLLWRLGLSLPLAYILPWAPISVLVTFLGFRAYVRRHLPRGAAASSALALGVFFHSPVAVLALDTGHWWRGIGELPPDLANSFALWGYFARAIAVALVPVMLLGIERLLDGSTARTSRRSVAALSAVALILSWLHPWQGAEVLIIILAVAVWTRPVRSKWLPLAAPAFALILPILYYAALDHYSSLWRSSETQAASGTFSFSPLVLAIGTLPLGVLALLALRRRLPTATHRRILLLWLVTPFLVYFLISNKDALDGVALPLSIFAVEGARRLRFRWLRRRVAGIRVSLALAVLGVAVCTIPGLEYEIHAFHQNEFAAGYGQVFTTDDFRAMSYLEHAPQPGGVLAPMHIAAAVPAYTGRNTYSGDFPWTPNFSLTGQVDMGLFYGKLRPQRAIELVRSTHARFVLVDCWSRGSALPSLIAPLIVSSHQFGCASVYTLRTD